MKRVQIIEHNGKPAFAVVPIELWERVRENIEEADDVAAYDRAVAKDDGFTIPAAVMRAELGGSHPPRAWREHRGMTLQAVADAAGVSKPYKVSFGSASSRSSRSGSWITAGARDQTWTPSSNWLTAANTSSTRPCWISSAGI